MYIYIYIYIVDLIKRHSIALYSVINGKLKQKSNVQKVSE